MISFINSSSLSFSRYSFKRISFHPPLPLTLLLHSKFSNSSSLPFNSGQSNSISSSKLKPTTPIIISILFTVGIGFYYHHSSTQSADQTLKIDRYTPCKILDSKLITKDSILLKLNPPLPNLNPINSLFYIESIYLKHPALQIERPYTPLSSITPIDPSNQVDNNKVSNPTIDLLVKRYADGDVSSYLHHIQTPGNQVEIRGPLPTWHHPNGSQIDELVFIAAGTGITPAIQLLRRFFKSLTQNNINQSLPKFQLIYLTRSLESAYFLDELESYKSNYPELMDFKLVVSNKENNSFSSKKSIDKVGHLEYSDIEKWVGNNEQKTRKMIVICGPESLICAVAGCKGPTLDSQGELGGMLKPLGYTSHQVVKL